MTTSSRPGSQLTDMLRRLRARPVSSWSVGEREPAMRAALQRLADLAADASEPGRGQGSQREFATDPGCASASAVVAVSARESGSEGATGSEVSAVRRAVPDVGLVALPDQLAVLVADARRAGVPQSTLDEVLGGLAAALSVSGR